MPAAGKRKNFIKRLKLFKFLIILLLSIFVTEQTLIPVAQAGIGSLVSGALSNSIGSVTTGQAGYYHSQGQGIYTLGYTRIRFNVSPGDVSLFSIQAPQFSIGCSGIDLMGGAISSITSIAHNLVKILEELEAAAPTFFFDIALGVLCKQCEAILNQIEAIANKLNGLNFNSCKAAQAAAGAVTGFLNKDLSNGATGGWLQDISNVMGTAPSSSNNFKGTGIEGTLATFESSIPSSDCQSGKTTTLAGQIQNIYNTISDCGASVAGKKFHAGSLLRIIADHSNLGLTDGGAYPAGSGGYDDILGIMRGSVLGDVYSYYHYEGKKTPIASFRNYNPVPAPNGQNIYSILLNGTSTSSSTTNNLTSAIIAPDVLPTDSDYGFNVASGVIISKAPSTFYSISKDDVCFGGFTNIYKQYLWAVANYYNMGTINGAENFTASSCVPSIGAVSPAEVDQIVAGTNVPVLESLKLAYALQEPGLITQTAQVVGAGALLQWIKGVINGINMAIYSGQNFNKSAKNSNAIYLKLLSGFQKRAMGVLQGIRAHEVNYRTNLHALLKTLNTANKDWVRQLSSAGLMGNYNFSKHLQ